ncbi:MAG: hypothetical protein CL583_13540 [Alteromonadaceae bacterium]|nr:hypothetical protein [Alteromonadaceae bacterium]
MDIVTPTSRSFPVIAQGQAQLAARAGADSEAEAKRVAREFEATFLTQVMEEMLKTVDTGSLDGGFAEEQWRSFLARAYADEMASRGTTGIAQSVERSIAAYREAMAGQGGTS